LSFKYFNFNVIVKKLKLISISAGNYFIYFNLKSIRVIYDMGTSETLRNRILISILYIYYCLLLFFINNFTWTGMYEESNEKISVHVPVHLKPINEKNFSHYLAGLIDGDGHFSNSNQLVISFHLKDISLAYYVKKRIGFGNVKKVKNKNAVIFVISCIKGLIVVLNLINGKLRHFVKLKQVNNILSNLKHKELNEKFKFTLNNNNDFNNYWLSGFSDADASFEVKILNIINRKKPEIRLNFQIDQKHKDLLNLIKDNFGGNIGYRSSQDTYYYGSTNFGSAKNIINYFDRFNLLSTKHINYLKWREVYLLIQRKDHLTERGLNKIIKLKKTMNNFNKDTIDLS